MPSYTICPECREQIAPDARRCACGWKKDSGPALDPFRGKCSWTDAGDRCRFPGSISHAQKGDGHWYCAFHFFNGDPRHAARITQSSFDWDGQAESYLRMRKDFEARAGMDAHTGSQRVDGIPQKIRELVQNLRIPSKQEEAQSP